MNGLKLLRAGSALWCAVIFSLGLANAAGTEPKYVEGTHYQVRSEQKSAQPEIREFFSFWCGHCFSLQPLFGRIADTYKDQAVFVKNPVGLLGGPMGPESQRAFAAATLMGLEPEFSAGLFEQMHVKNKIPHSHAQMAEFFARELGIPESRFEKDYNAFPVAGMVSSWDRAVDQYGIDAVPELLVNGKYLAVMESVEGEEELIDLIGYLLTLE